MKELLSTYKEYIEFLNSANNEPILLAAAHGWRCPHEDIEKGVQYRKKIQELENAL